MANKATERIARLYAMALDAFVDPAAAVRFMMATHPELGDRSPFETALTELGGGPSRRSSNEDCMVFPPEPGTRVYRTVGDSYPPFDGGGAWRWGRRWVDPGRTVVHAASSYSLAVLENLVHWQASKLPPTLVCVVATIPDAVRQSAEESVDLGDAEACRAVGERWFDDAGTAVMWVPSVVSPYERNVLIVQLHPDFAKIRVSAPVEASIDEPKVGDEGDTARAREWDLAAASRFGVDRHGVMETAGCTRPRCRARVASFLRLSAGRHGRLRTRSRTGRCPLHHAPVELGQRYSRIDASSFDYAAPSVPYAARLEVAPNGFVRSYPGLWEMVER